MLFRIKWNSYFFFYSELKIVRRLVRFNCIKIIVGNVLKCMVLFIVGCILIVFFLMNICYLEFIN